MTVLGLALLLLWSTEAWNPSSIQGTIHGRKNELLCNKGCKDSTILLATDRRAVIKQLALPVVLSLICPVSANAMEQELFTRSTDRFAYSFQPPSECTMGKKPLKTHLDEVNFFGTNGYQYGITVDPVRINSLREFGTAEEVAGSVVLAEIRRDGVFNVTLMEDPIDNNNGQYYQLNYKSDGKRGSKHFIAKFFVKDKMLYALTAQCKEDEYKKRRDEILRAVESFQVLDKRSSS